jgi:hypothetical protein
MRGSNRTLGIVLSLAVLLGFPLMLRAEDSDLTRLVKEIENRFHVRRTHIPLWGLMKPLVKVSTPHRGQGLDIAIFDEQSLRIENMEAFEKTVLATLGETWQPFVRIRSKRDGEQTLILVRPNGNKFKMMIVTCEPDEAVIVKLDVKWKDLASWVEDERENNHEREG